MREVTFFVGGSIGSDPLSPKTWSGSSAALVRAMQEAGLLDKAVGVELPRFSKTWLLAKNFTRNRDVWRRHFYFDPAYRRALTRAAGAIAVESPVCLQAGHMFSLPEVFPNKRCISYHDGSLVESVRSGFGFEGVSSRRVDQAIRYEEQAARSMTAIFTFSEYLRQSFITDYGVPAEKVINVGGGINFETLPVVAQDKTYTALRILFVGKDFVRKGGEILLRAFALLRQAVPEAELHIAGPVSMATVPPGVVFHGHLSKADPAQKQKLETLFEQASLFVLPSLYEPFGIAPLEAMLYRLPCVVTDGWALRESVTPGVNGELVEKGSVDSLAEAMKTLLGDPDHMARMGAAGRARVLEQYTWPTVAKRMASALASMPS